MADKIVIFDTTLRDGEQSPGFSMNLQEKVQLAHQLRRLKVDVIEAGFPASSEGDFESVRAVAEQVVEDGPQIAGLARSLDSDIDRCWEAVRASKRPRIHTFLATSPIHMERKLKKNPDEVLEMAVRAVRRARGHTENVEFSAEDSTRSERPFLRRIVEAVIDAGASTVNLPDTVGYSNPWEYAEMIQHLFERVPNIRKTVISVHCHNDLGLAVANSLAAVRAGARQIECTINGIGERAGNASLEEIVMNLRTRRDYFGVRSDVQTEQLYPTSRLLTRFTGIGVQPNKAIVGGNAFAHEAGIHQDGMLKERLTYEIMTPQSVGWTGSSMVLGKHSGRNAFSTRLKTLGFVLEGEPLNKAFAAFKDLADRKKIVFDEDLIAIVDEQSRAQDPGRYVLEDLTISIEGPQPKASVRLRSNGAVLEGSGVGNGALDAAFSVIKKLTATDDAKLVDYNVGAVSSGTDAQAAANLTLFWRDREAVGRGTDTDVLRASVKAFVHAVNRLQASAAIPTGAGAAARSTSERV